MGVKNVGGTFLDQKGFRYVGRWVQHVLGIVRAVMKFYHTKIEIFQSPPQKNCESFFDGLWHRTM